ncbi:MAG: hypothetical protein ACOVOT_04155 [Rubrivivax sp.]|nr:hypothetical protein [Rubrivivax sp.]
MSCPAPLLSRPSLHTWALAAALAVGTAHASPCDPGSDHLRPQADAGAAQRQPLLRPFLIRGLAVTAVQQHDGQRWLELAVDSTATAARTLSSTPAGALRTGPDRPGAVLLACSTLETLTTAALPPRALSAPLW